MMRRTLAYVLVLAAGVLGGLWGGGRLRAPECGSEDDCFDHAAYEQCSILKGTKRNLAVMQRSVAKPDSALPGVTDWVFMAYCDGSTVPVVWIQRRRWPV